jgi:hypothetical protein
VDDTEEDAMGAWGYGAYENDAAGDWMFKHVVPRLLRTISSKGADTHEVLAALAVAQDLGITPWLDAVEIDAAFTRIEKADDANGWDDPARRRRYVRTLQRRINKALGGAGGAGGAGGSTSAWSPLRVIASKDPPAKKTPSTKPRRTTKARVKARVKAPTKAPTKKAAK